MKFALFALGMLLSAANTLQLQVNHDLSKKVSHKKDDGQSQDQGNNYDQDEYLVMPLPLDGQGYDDFQKVLDAQEQKESEAPGADAHFQAEEIQPTKKNLPERQIKNQDKPNPAADKLLEDFFAGMRALNSPDFVDPLKAESEGSQQSAAPATSPEPAQH